MKAYGGSQVLVVDDDHATCELLGSMIQQWGLIPKTFCDPIKAVDALRDEGCGVVLLDLLMPHVTGFELIPEIYSSCSEAKIIIITGSADKENAIKALQLGAFDLLEKPVKADLLYHTLRRALSILDKERSLQRLAKKLRFSEAELSAQNRRLESLNAELMETNNALSVFAQSMERQREQVEKRVALKIRALVYPYIDRLRSINALGPHTTELDVLASLIEDLTSDFIMDARITSLLSSTELKIASLIKTGLSTEEISRQLHISPSTVRTHRKKIRKKLKIDKPQFSLRNYLVTQVNSSGNGADQ